VHGSDLLASLRSRDGYRDLPKGATDEEISALEQSLACALPASYKHFLKVCGYAEWFGHVVYGIAPDDHCSTEKKTLLIRERVPKGFRAAPRNGNVVASYGGGGFYFLHAEGAERPGAVSLHTDEDAWEEVDSWPTFTAFLKSRVTGS
jgi:hypothetical protein